MPKHEQEPVVEGRSIRDDVSYSHPAFGQIRGSRVQGTRTLYGSDFVHHHFVTIEISRSQLNRGLSHDSYFAREELIEVHLSEAQWATFVSSLNVGGGVPCTLDRVMGESMPEIPIRRQVDVVEEELKETLAAANKAIDDTYKAMESEIGQSLSGVKRAKLLEHVHRLRRLLDDHLPFMAKSFRKNMETTVERAKVEVNAYAENLVVRSGLAALRGASDSPIQIGDGKTKAGD